MTDNRSFSTPFWVFLMGLVSLPSVVLAAGEQQVEMCRNERLPVLENFWPFGEFLFSHENFISPIIQ